MSQANTPPECSTPHEVAEALELYTKQYDATDKLWSYFSTATLGVLGFTIAKEKTLQFFPQAAMIVFGYLVFCVGNFAALYRSQRLLEDIFKLAHPIVSKNGIALKPFRLCQIIAFYLAVVVTVCGAILYIALHT